MVHCLVARALASSVIATLCTGPERLVSTRPTPITKELFPPSNSSLSMQVPMMSQHGFIWGGGGLPRNSPLSLPNECLYGAIPPNF